MWPEISPIIFAHRGDCAHAPENTMSAFKMALEKGAPAIEFDVKLSADEQVIILHDPTLDRTTNGHGKIGSFSLAELQKLDAGTWFSEQFRSERLPTLEELFATLGKRIFMNVELTNYATPGDDLVPRVVELVKKFGLQESVMFSSFFPNNLLTAARLLPEVPCGLLAWTGFIGWPARTFGYRRKEYKAFHPFTKDVNLGLVTRVHAAGKRVHVWTVNEVDEIKRLVGLGVDGIFTDDPAQALKIIGKGT
jgi:glycerophosphoryl diester phosphodiesterase